MHEFLFLLARHGETDRSESPEYRGQSNTEEDRLNHQGRKTIRDTAAFISRLPMKIEYVISSDLSRTEESADIICEVLGLDEYHVDPLLRPLDTGDFAGKDKSENPIDEYLENSDKKFPNGESVIEFSARQQEFAKKIFGWIENGKLKAGSVLCVCHDDVIGYWLESQKKNPSDNYLNESPDAIKPGGVVLVTSGEILPIHGRNNGEVTWDGTKLTGLVSDLENRPPRECWNCKYGNRDFLGILGCTNSLVRIDPENMHLLQNDGSVAVGERWCCNYFTNKMTT